MGPQGPSTTNANTLYVGSDHDANEASSSLALGTDGATRIHVSSLGRVGIGTADARNRLDVEGEAVIGAGFAGNLPAPANGLLVEGKVGIGTGSVSNQLDVAGTVAIGDYAGMAPGTSIAKLIVGGHVGIGVPTPYYPLDVAGTTKLDVLRVQRTEADGQVDFFGGLTVGETRPQGDMWLPMMPPDIMTMDAGAVILGPWSGPGVFSTTVSFDHGPRFDDPPDFVLATVQGAEGANYPDVFAVTVTQISSVGFNVNVFRVDTPGAGWGQDLRLGYLAIDVP